MPMIHGCCSGGNVNGHDRMCRKSLPNPLPAERGEPEFCDACGIADISAPGARYGAVTVIGHDHRSEKSRYAVKWSGSVCLPCKDALVEDIALAFAHRLKRLRGSGAGQSCPAVRHTGDCARDDCVGTVCRAQEEGAYGRRRPAAVRVYDGDDLQRCARIRTPLTGGHTSSDLGGVDVPPIPPPARTYRRSLWARFWAIFHPSENESKY